MTDHRHIDTDRLHLDAPTADDLPALFAIYSDPAVWTHIPTLRHTEVAETRRMLDGWIASWGRDGLGPWMVRAHDESAVLGHAGCSVRHDAFWNLGYRFAADTHGHGYATEAAIAAVATARDVRPDLPVVAYLLEHNVASMKVAEKVGLQLRHRAPDAGNPDPDAVRLVYADRELTSGQLAAALR